MTFRNIRRWIFALGLFFLLGLLLRGTLRAQGSITAMAVRGCTDVLVNGDFEGTGGWIEYSRSGASLISNFPPPSGAYHSGERGAYLGDDNNAHDYIAQTVEIPGNAISVTLSYWWQVESDEDPAVPGDFLTVTVDSPLGTVLAAVDTLSSANAGTTWQEHRIDLSAYRGRRITLRFDVRTDASLPTAFFLDDIALDVCTPAPTSSVHVYLPWMTTR